MVSARGTAGSSYADHIVGRAEQRDQLRRVLDDVIDDGSRFVIVGGDAGSGKTTVIEAFVADLGSSLADRKPQLIRGQCVPLGGDGLPYAPVVGALRDLLAQHGRDQVLEWAGAGRAALGALLPDLADATDGSESIRLQLFEAITMLWERATELGPLVVIMEDIHWADESTRHLLRFLARALTDAPVMIIASYRTDELTRRHPLRPFLAEIGRLNGTVRVEVGNLDRAEVAELLAQLLDRPPSNPVIDMVFRRSEGIPYFVEELTRSASRGCIDMPDTLRDALNVRIQTLSDEAQRVVELAAVAGNRVDHQLLEAAATGTGVDLDQGLREAIDAAVLTADDTGYSFRHALLREVVHDDLMPGQHARLHARFATIMEAQPELVGAGTAALEIAHHWSAAHETNKAFRWSITAARSGSAAFHETLKMYERALELWDQVEEPESVAGSRALVLKQAAVVARDAGEDERALALVSAALDEAGPGGDPEERIKALMLKALQLASLMRPGSVEPLREAVALLPDDASPILRGRVLDDLAKRMMFAGEVAGGVEVAYQAAEAGKEAARVAERQAADGSATSAGGWVDWLLSNVHNTLGTGLASIGEESAGLAEYALARDLARGNTKIELRYFINYSDMLHLTGRYQDSVDVALAGIELARSKGLERSIGAMLAGNAAEPMIALGQWEPAYAMIKRALELDPPVQHTAHLRLMQAWLRIWRGELEEADAVLGEFRKMIVDGHHAPQYTNQVIRTDTEHALAVGDHERAWTNATVFFEHWDTYHCAWTYPMLALAAAAAAALDHQDRAGRRSAMVQEFVDQRARKINIRPFWLPVITAELADTADGWRTALEQLDGLPVPAHLPPYAGLRLAQHLVAARERAEAKVVLGTAVERATGLGARLLIDRLTALTQRAGFAVASESTPTPLAGLTSREIEVLQLVAAGRSNGEIGTALFISTKTASVHVSNILAKLGVSGRGEAAALAHRLGLVPA